MNEFQDRLLKIDEVSQLTGLSIGTLYHYCSEGRIPVVRLSKRCIRFRLSALLNWFSEMDVNASRTSVKPQSAVRGWTAMEKSFNT